MTNREFDEASYCRLNYATALTASSDTPDYSLFLDFLNLQTGERVLDIGCGLGMLVAAMHDRGTEVIGVDASPFAVKLAQQRCPTATFVVLNGNQLTKKFKPSTFDAITCVQVLEHIPPDQVDDFISQIAECLRDGGRLLLDVPVTDNLSDKWLVFRNQYLRGDYKPPGAIDSSFVPTHLWKIGKLNSLIDCFRAHSLEPERVHKLYYVPWVLERLARGHVVTYLPARWLEQLLKGATILLRKGIVGNTLQTAAFSAFWADPPRVRGIEHLRKLLV